MDNPDDLLGYLVEGLIAPQRDLVTKAFYKYAGGDPNSGPVNEAILLTAVSRLVALTPRELRAVSADFNKLLDGAREMEARIRERVELSNYGVVASFKDEATRATTQLRAAAQNNKEIVAEGREIADTMKDLVVQGKELLRELRDIRTELKLNRESNQKTAEATENNKTISLTIKEIVTHLTDSFAINWISVGVIIGGVLAGSLCLFPWWVPALLVTLAIGLLQAMARISWKFVKEKVATIKPLD